MTDSTAPSRVTALLRTVVPSLWGSALAWLLAAVVLPQEVVTLLESPLVTEALVALSIGAWYALWTWLEPRLWPWVTRLLLGSNKQPSYSLAA